MMNKIYLILCCLILTSCIKKEKVNSSIFTYERINQWEIATYDTIANMLDRNRNNSIDSLDLVLLKNHYLDLYNHQARRCFIEQMSNDTAFINAHIGKCVIIEKNDMESNMSFEIFSDFGNATIYLSYKLSDKGNANKKIFVLEKKETIDKAKSETFIQNVRISDLFKKKNDAGEYYYGAVIISFFSQDKVEVFPYLTFNFSSEVYNAYNAMFK